jgi:hypothetical protein
VTVPLSPEAFYESAQGFARSALQAHYDRAYRRVALDAGTALEHLTKACLAKRSPAFLAELTGSNDERNFASLLQLINLPEDGPPWQVRTVGLRNALTRVAKFVTSSAPSTDLGMLVSMRDGTVHAAMDDEVETRLLAAFALHADALLADLDCDRARFWGDRLEVVNALLADASNKVARDVAVKLAGAHAYFADHYGEGPTQLLEIGRMRYGADERGDDEMVANCPVCDSLGLATGLHDVEYRPSDRKGRRVIGVSPVVWFIPSTFECRVCHLRLDSSAEIIEAGMEPRWQHEGADPRKYQWIELDKVP